MHKKDGEIAVSKKKLYESLEKQSTIAKGKHISFISIINDYNDTEKQELSERMLALIKEQELDKQPEPDDKEEQGKYSYGIL